MCVRDVPPTGPTTAHGPFQHRQPVHERHHARHRRPHPRTTTMAFQPSADGHPPSGKILRLLSPQDHTLPRPVQNSPHHGHGDPPSAHQRRPLQQQAGHYRLPTGAGPRHTTTHHQATTSRTRCKQSITSHTQGRLQGILVTCHRRSRPMAHFARGLRQTHELGAHQLG